MIKTQITGRIDALRKEMDAAGIAATIIPQTDPHQSEYISDHWQVRRWLSGFTGSAGSLIVTSDNALLWTDSRYFIQAADQLQDTGIVLMKDGLPSVPSISEYLTAHIPADKSVGIDGMLFSYEETLQLSSALSSHGISLKTGFDIIDKIWSDRPALPKGKVFVHEEKYAGLSAKTKIAQTLANANRQLAASAFISPLDEIAWVLNIRSNDVKYNPVATAYLYLSPAGSTLLIDPDKIDEETKSYLSIQGVSIMSYDKVKEFLSALPQSEKVLVEPARNAYTLIELLGSRAVKGSSPVSVLKGCKNSVQISGTKSAMERDGVALVKAFMEIERHITSGDRISEMDIAEILRRHRGQSPMFFDESFGTIAGYGPHGAIVHYEANESTDAEIRPDGLLLIDSGAQYLDGTTDITRTISLGNATPQQRRDFTLVMKGHIALGSMIYPAGTRGAQLDAIARQYLWSEGLSYLHGTGHGVGHFLNVHEGPQSIRLNYTPTPLMPGMITSNEPGIYREGIHGIRCENLVLCVPAMTTEFGEFLKFETLTLFPFDLNLFDTAIMTDKEIKWVNDYHSEVYARLSPYLTEDQRSWLKSKTAKLTR